MRRPTSHWMKLCTVASAVTLTVTLSACSPEDAPQEGNGAAPHSSGEKNGPEESPGDDEEGNGLTDKSLAGLDHQTVLTIGLEGGAAITCGYSFDSEELAAAKQLAMGDWVTPEATIHINAPTLHWEIPQAENRLSHLLMHDGLIYTWKVPGDNTGAMNEIAEEDGLDALAARLQKNAHDCVAFTGPASIFEVPSNREFTRFEDLLN